MKNPTWFVNGTARGIGLELVRALRAAGMRVAAGCRTPSADLLATGAIVVDGIDLAKADCVPRLVEGLKAHDIGQLDGLIMSAGIYPSDGALGELDFAAMTEGITINAVAQLRVVEALLPRMIAGGRIGLVTSRMGSIADNTSGGSYGYRMSKAALNMAGKNLAMDLAPRGISIAIIHPGFVRTEMTSNRGLINPDESARGILGVLERLTPQNTGTFWHQSGDIIPW